jgi:predicted nucleotidyltransferase
MSNKFGIYDRSLVQIKKLIGEFSEIEEARMFGSRVLGNYKKGSDIDIVVFGSKITLNTVIKLSNILDELGNTPYFIDVVNYHTISNKELQNHIDHHGIPFYVRKKIEPN